MKIVCFVATVAILLSAGCSQSIPPDHYPRWINELIGRFKNEPVGNPPQSIWQYEYRGEIVYYIPPQCCDQFSVLYDSYGNVTCAPDGGLGGSGDGRCPNFFTERKNEKLIWRDVRTR
jgi:hypothetical protein